MLSRRLSLFASSGFLYTRALALLFACSAPVLIGSERTAFCQSQLGTIAGVVTDEETGKPISSVTVVVNGTALQEFQSELTDGAGRYVITQLPPGDDYSVSFYFGASD